MIDRALLLLVFATGLWGIMSSKNIVKKVFGLSIINNAAVILFVLEGSRVGNHAPIMEPALRGIVDPLPQALMLTAIVIGMCVSALSLALVFRLYKATGSLDIDEIRQRLNS